MFCVIKHGEKIFCVNLKKQDSNIVNLQDDSQDDLTACNLEQSSSESKITI